MIQSMTGYGKVSDTFQGKTITVELKSLNSKSFDVYLRLASQYRDQELAIRQIVNENLDRGKIDVSVVIENTSKSKSNEINKELAITYLVDLKELNTIVQQEHVDYLGLILKMPDIFIQSNEETSDEELEFLIELLKKTCQEVILFRNQEGKALEKDFIERINAIKKLLTDVELFEKIRIESVRERMSKSLEEMKNAQIDQNRFEQELIFYIEKMDISEEKMRLSNHLDYFLETMKIPLSGKKLGFITQELGREINTLGSKSYQVDLQKIVVEMKDNLEKIKEQVLNTL
jgi:uncharacterized protein (TIGR00255 family)